MIWVMFIIGAIVTLVSGWSVAAGDAHPSDLPALTVTTAIGAIVMFVAVLLHKGLIG